MNNKVPTPVTGDPETKGAPDGVSDAPGSDAHGVSGRNQDGESGGGAYPNPHAGKTPDNGGFMGHGGQTEMAYHGGGQGGENGASAPNAATGSDDVGDVDGSSGVPVAASRERTVSTGDGAITVEETSGVAVAEASGKIGTDAPHDDAQDHPGSG
jgi:hypothetical protein